MTRGIHPIDPGLQSERTLLSWRRTCLTLALGYGASIHLLSPILGRIALYIGLVGLASVAVTWALPHVRYLRWRPHLTEVPHGLRIGGVPLAAMTAVAIASGCVALVIIARL